MLPPALALLLPVRATKAVRNPRRHLMIWPPWLLPAKLGCLETPPIDPPTGLRLRGVAGGSFLNNPPNLPRMQTPSICWRCAIRDLPSRGAESTNSLPASASVGSNCRMLQTQFPDLFVMMVCKLGRSPVTDASDMVIGAGCSAMATRSTTHSANPVRGESCQAMCGVRPEPHGGGGTRSLGCPTGVPKILTPCLSVATSDPRHTTSSQIHSSGCLFQHGAHDRSNTTLVPDLRFADVNVNSCVRPQRFSRDCVDGAYPVRLRKEVHINQEMRRGVPLGSKNLWTCCNASCCPKENSNGISASPCSPPSLCAIGCTTPKSSSQR